MYIPSIIDPPSKGKDTAEYKAFMDVSTSLIETLKATPDARDALSNRFMQKGWIATTATSSESELVHLACNKIKQKASEYETVLKMLKEMEGMDIVVETLEGIHIMHVTTFFLCIPSFCLYYYIS